MLSFCLVHQPDTEILTTTGIKKEHTETTQTIQTLYEIQLKIKNNGLPKHTYEMLC
jgi:hypothetical protein